NHPKVQAPASHAEFIEDLLREPEVEATDFAGVVAPIDPRIETAEEVRNRILIIIIPVELLATTDDCGFASFSDDTSRNRDTAFPKIAMRVMGTALAEKPY